MSDLFPNQTFGRSVLVNRDLPLYITNEFDFVRCVEFNDSMYGKTVSELHAGNLRLSRSDNRYSNLFPGQRLSYWADSPKTARAEIKRWGAKNNILTFWAYDDGSSTFPTIYPRDKLKIIDGRQMEFNAILRKLNKNERLNREDRYLIDQIAYEEPDCLCYESEARKGGVNYLFFEHGFKKLSLKEVRIQLNDLKGRNHNCITCAYSSDYSPWLDAYGYMFLPIAKIGNNPEYPNSDEYILRDQAYQEYRNRFIRWHEEND